MITFITNMQQASQVIGESNTPRSAINQWISDRALGGTYASAEAFLGAFAVTNVTTSDPVEAEDLDSALEDGNTLSVYTKAVATGGVKGAVC